MRPQGGSAGCISQCLFGTRLLSMIPLLTKTPLSIRRGTLLGERADAHCQNWPVLACLICCWLHMQEQTGVKFISPANAMEP